MKRYYTSEINFPLLGSQIHLSGWIASKRNHGKVIFIVLRDIKGLIQVVFDSKNEDSYTLANILKNEYVVRIKGAVVSRDYQKLQEDDLLNSQFEILGEQLEIINSSLATPLPINNYYTVEEEKRLRYRYLDLRRMKMQQIFLKRSRISRTIRDFLERDDFVEVETPLLTKVSTFGAKPYLVTTKSNLRNSFYSLPQSPQIFKQLLMISGFDRYYQIAKCFRDENLRADLNQNLHK